MEHKQTKTLQSYVVGFVLSAVLTLIAFSMVEMQILTSTSYIYLILLALAIVQLVVQSTCFLGLNNSDEGRWNLLPFLFVILIVTFLVVGSLWIMFHLNYNMTH